jgi:transposase
MPNNTVCAKPTGREVGQVTGGVDTHADTHTAAALDQVGGLLGSATFAATPDGYAQIHTWFTSFGPVSQVGIEGTGSYGAGLTRHLQGAGVCVIEVSRPNRADRRGRGKSDPIDAEHAARAVLAGTATATPKDRTGIVESIRAIHRARRGAVKARTAARNQFTAAVLTAPDVVRTALQPLTSTVQIKTAAAWRPTDITNPVNATKTSLRRYARRIQYLNDEIADADHDIAALTAQAAPDLLAEPGIGPDTAAQLLITAGDNPNRLHTEASFAALCGVSPVPASSGKTRRHRLNRGGDRQANRALYMTVLTRMRHDQPTRDYVTKARSQGKTTKEIIRQLKRYVARRTYRIITTPTPKPRLDTT